MAHDNMTALVYLSVQFDLHFHKEIKILGRYWHPRDWIFYGRAKYGKIFNVFEPLFRAINLQSVNKYYKYRTNKYDRKIHPIKSVLREFAVEYLRFKLPDVRKILHTDGKFLAYIRCSLGYFPETAVMVEETLIKRFGPEWRYAISTIYFKYPKHPIKVITKGVI